MTVNSNRVSLAFVQIPDDELVVFSAGVVAGMAAPAFAAAPVKTPELTPLQTDFAQKVTIAENGGRTEIAARNVTKLVVDVRGNEGGNDCGDLVAARLIDAPIAREGYARRTRYRQTPERLNQYLDTWDRSFRNWGDDAVPRDDGFYELRGEADVDQIEPLGPRFRGDVDVLIDSQNSSATFQFASCIKTNRLGRLIGAPTGGNQRGINGGAFFFLRLPASGLEADVPLIARFPPAPKPDAGIAPDVEIALTREDIAAGRDAALEFALG